MNLNSYKWDLVITYPKEKKATFPFQEINNFKENTRFYEVGNKGFDIGPFVIALKSVNLDNYDIVFKIQSKGVFRKLIFIYKQLFFNRDWFTNLYEGILGSKSVHQTINKIFNSSGNKLMSAKNLYVHDPIYKEHLANKKLAEYGLKLPNHYKFVAGTCFASSSQYLKKIQKLPFQISDFSTVPNTRGLSLAHALERFLTAVPIDEYDGNEVNWIRRLIRRPLEKLFISLSSERLLKHYFIDDEYMLFGLDNQLVYAKEKKLKLVIWVYCLQ